MSEATDLCRVQNAFKKPPGFVLEYAVLALVSEPKIMDSSTTGDTITHPDTEFTSSIFTPNHPQTLVVI